jgi:regulatory protein
VRDKTSDVFQKAQAYCFLLLKFRLRSENELYSRLKRKKFDETVIRKTLDFLKEKKFIDDAAFSRLWADSRLKKGIGIRRITQELALKGVDKRLVDNEAARIKESYPQAEMAKAVARQRLEKLKGLDPQKVKARIYGYLMRRGFSPDVIIDIVNDL